MIYRKQVIELMRTTTQKANVTVLVPAEYTASEQRRAAELSADATGAWLDEQVVTKIVNLHTTETVDVP